MSEPETQASTAPQARHLPKTGWLSLAGTGVCVGLIGLYLSQQVTDSFWSSFAAADLRVLLLTVPLVLINMALRSVRWRSLLDAPADATFRRTFAALMIGYLANNVLPVRLGDLVRVVVLAGTTQLSRSRILSTVLLERLLDVGMVVLLLTSIAFVGSLPAWLRSAALATGVVTILGFAGVCAMFVMGPGAVSAIRRWLPFLPTGLTARLGIWVTEFNQGVSQFRRPAVATAFFGGTLAIWLSEIGIVVTVARAFHLALEPLDAGVLMLFSLFSSFIPALPGQIGTFEAAMLLGLEFLQRSSPSGIAFALCLHLVLLAGTSLLGLLCLLSSGLPLLPRKFVERIQSGR